ncbi:hypothetical protein B0H13DRAFT_1851154 [Mycena leptocephala]|nr:hypothetical protein B0H13DRAFT_1851154 [Mycena leptocephala]
MEEEMKKREMGIMENILLAEKEQHETAEAKAKAWTESSSPVTLKVAMRALGFDMKPTDVLKILRGHDKSGHDLMIFEDFAQIVSERTLARDPMDEIRLAFKLFDDDNTGKVSLRNLRRVAKQIGDSSGDNDLQAMIEEFDMTN